MTTRPILLALVIAPTALAVAVALRDLRRAVEIPAGPPSPVPHEAAPEPPKGRT
jgi:hypothetical protein